MQQPSGSTPSRMTPQDIRRRVNDLDIQVRQGLEEGTIRKVMKDLGPVFVSPRSFLIHPALTCSL
jgi:hypothetical protein